ncbi:hypothetical protein DUNSADRAFT_3647 [Dunaliella salina]|uniref:Encoded protein n=1 Tax=Dunaliella salina TaxID=3046 RepID=A0ABQ7FVF1_DUNSA|nr:hypothetical protein DUNSADRAFT_3647 [Dunaliella salina]|eukprot:KAF5826313.1 hypothetical protein DUNSADRAFT_3647 [Dunaliella salina]
MPRELRVACHAEWGLEWRWLGRSARGTRGWSSTWGSSSAQGSSMNDFLSHSFATNCAPNSMLCGFLHDYLNLSILILLSCLCSSMSVLSPCPLHGIFLVYLIARARCHELFS